jgi:hypothetical protein
MRGLDPRIRLLGKTSFERRMVLEQADRTVGKPKLRFYADRFSAGASSASLGQTNRVVYVADGTAVLRGADVSACLGANCVWQGRASITVDAGPRGARLLRWELSAGEPELLRGANLTSELILEGEPMIEPGVEYLMRCDRVDFPPGGVALTHTHQGPGTRDQVSAERPYPNRDAGPRLLGRIGRRMVRDRDRPGVCGDAA